MPRATRQCPVCQKEIQVQNLSRHRRLHRWCPSCNSIITGSRHNCTRWSWIRLDMALPTNGFTELTEPEPQYGYLPILVQSQLPDNPVKELVLTTPSPDDIVPLFAPNTKNLIDRSGKEARENEAMAKAIEDRLYVPILPLDLLGMMRKRIHLQRLERSCFGCVYDCSSQRDHMAQGGCLEWPEEAIEWIEFVPAFERSAEVLGYVRGYPPAVLASWMGQAIETLRDEFLCPSDETTEPGVELVQQEVTEFLLEVLSDGVKMLHQEMQGLPGHPESPLSTPLTRNDILVQFAHALKELHLHNLDRPSQLAFLTAVCKRLLGDEAASVPYWMKF